ncbi:MAG: hypothetical protein RL708_1660 [Bacteroidota bacterium]|jgi:outer membrane cobalamin receptor
MKFFILAIHLFLISAVSVIAQSNIKFKIKDAATTLPLQGVIVVAHNGTDTKVPTGGVTNENGELSFILTNDSIYQFTISFIGYEKQIKIVNANSKNDVHIKIELQPLNNQLNEVHISANRTNARIEDIATKVEVLGEEEMVEESTIKPGNIASLLGDLSIIHIQQTSVVNGSSVVRMQGLDGQYTQMVRDGLPMYEGFSGSFGLLSIPPLDLKQAEIIKGSASTLYGGGAIAGLINLVSKQPTDSLQGTLLLNQSSLKESNVNLFLAKRNKKTGYTFFAAQNFQQAVDVNKDGLSDVPYLRQTIVHPQFFVYPTKKSNIIFGLHFVHENRIGGDMEAINVGENIAHSFIEKNKSNRISVDVKSNFFIHHHHLNIKAISSLYDKSTFQMATTFSGNQLQNFVEISDAIEYNKHKLVYGVSMNNENFTKQKNAFDSIFNYQYTTLSAFIQHDFAITKKVSTELGLRLDNHNRYGNFVLPRLSILYRPKNKLSVRIGGGSGYKSPALFSKQTSEYYFLQFTMPTQGIKPENSFGLNADINYHTHFKKILITINQALYYTQIKDAVFVQLQSNNFLHFFNSDGLVKSDGTDTYIRFKYDDIECYVGYNHTIGKKIVNQVSSFLTLVPQDKFSTTLAYEIEGKWRTGIEASYNANQYLPNLSKAKNYWFFAAMIERKFKFGSLVLNAENLLDYRQSRKESLYVGTIQNPQFKPLWAPIDGRIINLSLKINI